MLAVQRAGIPLPTVIPPGKAAMTEIPGYRIVRELGRDGIATVYLAVQEAF